jgi:hypothetical protein
MEFNYKRTLKLLIRELYVRKQSLVYSYLAVSAILLFISFLTVYFNPNNYFEIIQLYVFVTFVGGLVFTSNIFDELISAPKAISYLTVPASSLEKLSVAWIVTFPIFWIISFIIMFITFIIPAFVHGGFEFTVLLSSFLNSGIHSTIMSYIWIQPIFMLGAVYFKKSHFIKTLLSIAVMLFALGIYTLINMRLIFDFTYINYTFQFQNTFFDFPDMPVMKSISYIFPILLIVISFFKLKEKEL